MNLLKLARLFSQVFSRNNILFVAFHFFSHRLYLVDTALDIAIRLLEGFDTHEFLLGGFSSETLCAGVGFLRFETEVPKPQNKENILQSLDVVPLCVKVL